MPSGDLRWVIRLGFGVLFFAIFVLAHNLQNNSKIAPESVVRSSSWDLRDQDFQQSYSSLPKSKDIYGASPEDQFEKVNTTLEMLKEMSNNFSHHSHLRKASMNFYLYCGADVQLLPTVRGVCLRLYQIYSMVPVGGANL